MTTDAVGGVWQYSLALSRGLAAMYQSRVLLVCFGEPNREDLREAVPVPGVDVVALKLKLEWMADSRQDIQTGSRELTRLAKEWRPDVVHSNQFCFGGLDTDAPRVVVAHSDLLSWVAWHRNGGELDLDSVENDPTLGPYRDVVARGLAGASGVVCPSKFMSQHLDETYGCPSETIYNGLWPDLYPHVTKQPGAVVAGRLWDEAKMALVAVEAARELPLNLKMVGPLVGPSGERASLPDAPNVTYRGALGWKQSREEIASASIYLATSSYEPFGLSALEAALSGCAIVANDIPSFRELWKDAALYYARNDASDLRLKLTRLIDRPQEAEKLGRAARTRALERYNGQRMATQYYRLYQNL